MPNATASTPAEPAAPPAADTDDRWNWVDTAGILAGVFLLVIVIDIVSDGRLISRRLRGRQQPAPEPETVPND